VLLSCGSAQSSFRRSTDIFKSQSIGSTGDHKCRSDLAINRRFDQSTDEFTFDSIGSTGVQFQICRSLGRTAPTQSTGAQTLGIGSTGVKENRGSHLSYMGLVRAVGFSLLCFARLLPSHAAAAPQSPPRRHHSPSLAHDSRRRSPARRQQSRRRRAFTTAPPARPPAPPAHAPPPSAPLRSRTRARAANTPPVRCRHRVPPRRRQGQSRRPCTTRRPRSSTLHRNRSRSAFSLAGCSTFCPSHFLRCFRAALAFQHSRATF